VAVIRQHAVRVSARAGSCRTNALCKSLKAVR
jgi:hypothetical protein